MSDNLPQHDFELKFPQNFSILSQCLEETEIVKNCRINAAEFIHLFFSKYLQTQIKIQQRDCQANSISSLQNFYIFEIQIEKLKAYQYGEFTVKAFNKKESKNFLAIYLIGAIRGNISRLWNLVFKNSDLREKYEVYSKEENDRY